jgi:phosphonate transport system permease protein
LALLAGGAMALLASQSWWSDAAGGKRAAGPVVYASTRAVIALSRSVHELLWAVLFLAAMGLTPLAAVVAIAIPYAGVFAKVFSEMLDEAPRDTAAALRDAGASPLRAFVFGLVPRALPDMTGYAFYRFECALRSAAVLGFFGIPTLGLFVQQSFANAHYREVWSYLYAMFALVVMTDAWSGAVRRRMVA